MERIRYPSQVKEVASDIDAMERKVYVPPKPISELLKEFWLRSKGLTKRRILGLVLKKDCPRSEFEKGFVSIVDELVRRLSILRDAYSLQIGSSEMDIRSLLATATISKLVNLVKIEGDREPEPVSPKKEEFASIPVNERSVGATLWWIRKNPKFLSKVKINVSMDRIMKALEYWKRGYSAKMSLFKSGMFSFSGKQNRFLAHRMLGIPFNEMYTEDLLKSVSEPRPDIFPRVYFTLNIVRDEDKFLFHSTVMRTIENLFFLALDSNPLEAEVCFFLARLLLREYNTFSHGGRAVWFFRFSFRDVRRVCVHRRKLMKRFELTERFMRKLMSIGIVLDLPGGNGRFYMTNDRPSVYVAFPAIAEMCNHTVVRKFIRFPSVRKLLGYDRAYKKIRRMYEKMLECLEITKHYHLTVRRETLSRFRRYNDVIDALKGNPKRDDLEDMGLAYVLRKAYHIRFLTAYEEETLKFWYFVYFRKNYRVMLSFLKKEEKAFRNEGIFALAEKYRFLVPPSPKVRMGKVERIGSSISYEDVIGMTPYEFVSRFCPDTVGILLNRIQTVISQFKSKGFSPEGNEDIISSAVLWSLFSSDVAYAEPRGEGYLVVPVPRKFILSRVSMTAFLKSSKNALKNGWKKEAVYSSKRYLTSICISELISQLFKSGFLAKVSTEFVQGIFPRIVRICSFARKYGDIPFGRVGKGDVENFIDDVLTVHRVVKEMQRESSRWGKPDRKILSEKISGVANTSVDMEREVIMFVNLKDIGRGRKGAVEFRYFVKYCPIERDVVLLGDGRDVRWTDVVSLRSSGKLRGKTNGS